MNENMSELMQNFSKMMNNQEMPENIKNILNSMSNQNSNSNGNSNNNSENDNSYSNYSNPENNSSSNSNNIFDNLDFNTIMKMQQIMNSMKSQQNDSRTNLLLSLKPYLKESRKNKVDTYIQLMKMGKIFEIMNPLGGDDKHA